MKADGEDGGEGEDGSHLNNRLGFHHNRLFVQASSNRFQTELAGLCSAFLSTF